MDTVLPGSRTYEPLSTYEFPQRFVLVHGSMDRQAGFAKLARVLRQDHSVTTYDRRGYASSDHLSGPFDIDQQVQDLVDVIDGRPSVLIGHSFGGTVALACAQRHRHLVNAVIVYENPMPWLEWWPPDTGAGRAARTRQEPERAAEEFLVRFIGQRLWDRLPESTKNARRREGRALVGELSAIQSSPAFERDSIAVPLAVGVGSLAKEYMRRGAEYLAQKRDGRMFVLDGAHHNAHASEPKNFFDRIVNPLLGRLRSGQWPEGSEKWGEEAQG